MWIESRIYFDEDLKTGEVFRGNVDFSIPRRTEFKDITVYIVGMSYFKVRRGFRYLSRSYEAEDVFLRMSMDGLDKGDEETKTLESGSHTIDFAFDLPKEMPPSYDVTKSSACWRITYHIHVLFTTKMEFRKEFIKEFYVYDELPLGLNGVYDFSYEVFTSFWKKHQNIEIKAELAMRQPVGDVIGIKYSIKNYSDVTVKSIVSKLVRRTTLTHEPNSENSKTFVMDEVVSTRYSDFIKKQTNKVFYNDFLMTSVDDVYVRYSKIIRVEHFINIELVLPMPRRNVVLGKIPIFLGPVKNNDDSEDDDDDDDFYDEGVDAG